MGNYSKGADFERRVKKILENRFDYFVVRQPVSACPDLIAIRPMGRPAREAKDMPKRLIVECKSDDKYISSDEEEILTELEDESYGWAYVAHPEPYPEDKRKTQVVLCKPTDYERHHVLVPETEYDG